MLFNILEKEVVVKKSDFSGKGCKGNIEASTRRTEMKKVIILLAGILISLIFVDSVFAQLEKGKAELSFGASFMGMQPAQEGEESNFGVNISTRLGYFFTRRFEAEPEIIFTSYEHQKAGVILSANLLYNQPLAEGSRIVPFLLAGGGWANSVHLLTQINSNSGEEATISGEGVRNYQILNLGTGARFFLTNSIALRLEYRFQRFFAKKEELDVAGRLVTYDPTRSYHNVMVGLSFAW